MSLFLFTPARLLVGSRPAGKGRLEVSIPGEQPVTPQPFEGVSFSMCGFIS